MAEGNSRMKSDVARKTEAVKEIHQFKTKVQTLEREKKSQLYNRHSDFRKEFSVLEEMDEKYDKDIKAERVKMGQQLNKVRTMVKKFHRELKDVKPTPEFVEKLKVIMEDIEAQILHFKEEQRKHYEELMKDERITSQEVTALEKRFESWAQAPPAVSARSNKSAPLSSHRETQRNLLPEVLAFEKFLQQTGGHRGGWDEYDHQTFLKYRNRHKGKISFLHDAYPALPTKTEAEVRQHEKWYQEYLQMNELKKEAIQRWREKKEEDRETAVEFAVKSDDEVNSDEEEKKQKREQLLEAEKIERRSKLNAWKVEKELRRAEEEEQKLRQELFVVEKKRKEEERRRQMRTQVEEYKQAKKEIEELNQMEDEIAKQYEADAKRMQSKEVISKFQERDQKALQDKMLKAKEKEQLEREKEKKLERLKSQVQVQVNRDPGRLYQLTEGWKERKKDSGPAGGGRVLHMQHRAVPSWRQGLH